MSQGTAARARVPAARPKTPAPPVQRFATDAPAHGETTDLGEARERAERLGHRFDRVAPAPAAPSATPAAPIQREHEEEQGSGRGGMVMSGLSHIGQMGNIAQGIGDATGRSPGFNAMLGVPSAFALKDAYADAKEGAQGVKGAIEHDDVQGGLESGTRTASGVGGFANSALSTAQTIGTMVENYGPTMAHHTAHALGTFTNTAVPGIGTATAGLETVARTYQGVQAQRQKNALDDLLSTERFKQEDAVLRGADDDKLAGYKKNVALLEYAAKTQEKRRNRAILNATSSGLITAGGATALATGATGVGAGVGAGLAASGAALKYGGGLTRTLKQKGRDMLAEQEEAVASGQREDVNPVLKLFNSGKSSKKKEAELTGHVEHLDALHTQQSPLAAQVLEHLGASKSQMHELSESTEAADRHKIMRELFKKRE